MVNDVLSQKQSNQFGLTPAIAVSPNFSNAQKSLADSNNLKYFAGKSRIYCKILHHLFTINL